MILVFIMEFQIARYSSGVNNLFKRDLVTEIQDGHHTNSLKHTKYITFDRNVVEG